MSIFFKKIFLGFGILVSCLVTVFLIGYVYVVFIIEQHDPHDVATPETQFHIEDSEEIAYRIWEGKSSQTVVFVGGLSAWSDTWESTVAGLRALGREEDFISVDLPPFGYSSPDETKGYSRVEQAKRIGKIIKAHAPEGAVVVGHSYGGGPVAELMLTQPDLVSQAILVSPVLNLGAVPKASAPFVLTLDSLRNAVLAVILHIEPLLYNRLLSFVYITEPISYDTLRMYTTPFSVDGTSARVSRWLYTYLTDPVDSYVSSKVSSYAQLQTLHLVWGEKDSLTPITDTKVLLEANKDITLTTLKEVGHIPMLEAGDYFNKTLHIVLNQRVTGSE